MSDFYLFPEDLGDEPSYYQCTFWKNVVLTDLQEEVWLVRVSPSLPTWLMDELPGCESDLLGLVAVDKTWTLRRVGEFGFIVDVLVVKDAEMLNGEPSSVAFSRFGTGAIGATPRRPQLKEDADIFE